MVLEAFTHGSRRLALAAEHASLDSTLDKEIEILWTGVGDPCRRSVRGYGLMLFVNCAVLPYASRRPVPTRLPGDRIATYDIINGQ